MRGTKLNEVEFYGLGFQAGFEAGQQFERALTDKPEQATAEEPKVRRKRRTKKYKWSYHQRKKLSAKLKSVHDQKKAMGLPWKGNHLKEQNNG